MTSGPSCLITRDSRQAAARSTSLRGANGMRSCPSVIRRSSSPSGCATSAARWPSARRPSTVCSTWLWPPRQSRAVSMWRENIAIQAIQSRMRTPGVLSGRYVLEVGSWALGVLCSSQSLANFRNTEYALTIERIEAGRAVEEAAAQDVVAQERGRRMDDEIEEAGAASALVHLPRGERGVVVDAIELVAQVAERVVLELVATAGRPARRRTPIRARTSRAIAPRAGRRAGSGSRDRSRSSGSSCPR